jgi:hypothetical protein
MPSTIPTSKIERDEGMTAMQTPSPVHTVFICYSHADRKWLERLRVHLKTVEKDANLDIWDDSRLEPGKQWKEEIEAALQRAKAAILLISADFLASDFITQVELPSLLAASAERGMAIIPVILGPCRFERIEHLSDLQSINSPDRPLISMSTAERERVIVAVVNTIEDMFPSGGPEEAAPPGAKGNMRGVATGPVVLNESDIEKAHRETGMKVILVTDEPHLQLPFDSIAGIICTGGMTVLSHVYMDILERGIPTVFANQSVDLPERAEVTVDSDGSGDLDKVIVFDDDFVQAMDTEYRAAVARYASEGADIPGGLLQLVFTDPHELPKEFLGWATTWGPLHEICRAVLPLVARRRFSSVVATLEHLCSAYEWPVGRQEARRVLPQIAYYRPTEMKELLQAWMRSGELYKLKSAAMMLGSAALMGFPLVGELTETILTDQRTTVVKEAARALPNIVDVDPSLAESVADHCGKFPNLLGSGDYRDVVRSYLREYSGLGLSAIPGYLRVSREMAFEKVEATATLLEEGNIDGQEANLARNYFVANLLLLAQSDAHRLERLVERLAVLMTEKHLQVDLFFAAVKLRDAHDRLARRLVEIGEMELDPVLVGFHEEVKAIVGP